MTFSSEQKYKHNEELFYSNFPGSCSHCTNPIWNPAWWDSAAGMCGVCTTGESDELYHISWIAPNMKYVDTDEKFMVYWLNWYYTRYDMHA